ncbi:zinc-binding alcohol dehydrogenase family protein [Actinomadura nitritigenes]|uniref:quinone oxidoreductase family protein n=1 Tax=Actinomadura nitritigenes TaxID=134602 RepID=UPI0036AB5515
MVDYQDTESTQEASIMKAVVLGTDDRFHLTDLDEPTPGPGQVAIRVAYAGIQYGDVLVRNGHFPVPRPFVPGFEAAGHIIAVGDGIDPARIGTPVIALTSAGAYAEVVIAPAVLTLEATGLDPRVAAGFGWITSTAYDLINTVTRVRPGDRLLIHVAAGGVGTLAAQFAKAAGAAAITGIVGNQDQADYAAPFGYDQVLMREQFPQALADEQFDVILAPIGGPTRHASLERLAPHGRLVVYRNIATFEAVEVSANDLLMQGKTPADLQQQPTEPDPPRTPRRQRSPGPQVPDRRPGPHRHHRRIRTGRPRHRHPATRQRCLARQDHPPDHLTTTRRHTNWKAAPRVNPKAAFRHDTHRAPISDRTLPRWSP